MFGEWWCDRVRGVGGKEGRKGGWDRLQRAWSVLLKNLGFISLLLKVIPLKVLDKGNHFL